METNKFGFHTFDGAPISPLVVIESSLPMFSFFRAPITNTQPHSRATLKQIYNAIRGDYYKPQTDKLRQILNTKIIQEGKTDIEIENQAKEIIRNARNFKSQNFDYCTFSGIFTTRSDKAMLRHSKLMCFDFDNVENLNALRFQLQTDEYLNTQLLFTSPSGNGLKWIISVDANAHTHADYFHAIADYLKRTYNVEVDKSGKDLSRACFLPHDPHVYINSYQLMNTIK